MVGTSSYIEYRNGDYSYVNTAMSNFRTATTGTTTGLSIYAARGELLDLIDVDNITPRSPEAKKRRAQELINAVISNYPKLKDLGVLPRREAPTTLITDEEKYAFSILQQLSALLTIENPLQRNPYITIATGIRNSIRDLGPFDDYEKRRSEVNAALLELDQGTNADPTNNVDDIAFINKLKTVLLTTSDVSSDPIYSNEAIKRLLGSLYSFYVNQASKSIDPASVVPIIEQWQAKWDAATQAGLILNTIQSNLPIDGGSIRVSQAELGIGEAATQIPTPHNLGFNILTSFGGMYFLSIGPSTTARKIDFWNMITNPAQMRLIKTFSEFTNSNKIPSLTGAGATATISFNSNSLELYATTLNAHIRTIRESIQAVPAVSGSSIWSYLNTPAATRRLPATITELDAAIRQLDSLIGSPDAPLYNLVLNTPNLSLVEATGTNYGTITSGTNASQREALAIILGKTAPNTTDTVLSLYKEILMREKTRLAADTARTVLTGMLNPSRTSLRDPDNATAAELATANTSRELLPADDPVRIAYEKAILEYYLTQISKYNALISIQASYANDSVTLNPARDAVATNEEIKTATYKPYTLRISGSSWTMTAGNDSTADTRDIKETLQYAALVLEVEALVNLYKAQTEAIIRERAITSAPTPVARPALFTSGQTGLIGLKTITINNIAQANTVIARFQENAEFFSMITNPTDRTAIVRKYAEALAFKEAYDRLTTTLDRIKEDSPANNSTADLETLTTLLNTPASRADLQKTKDDPAIQRALEDATRSAIDDSSTTPYREQERALDALRAALENAKRDNTLAPATADRLIQLVDQRKAEIESQRQAEETLTNMLNPARTALDPSKINGRSIADAEAARLLLPTDHPVRIAYEKALLEYALTQISKYNALLRLQPNYLNDPVALSPSRDVVVATEEMRTATYNPYTLTITGTAWTLTAGAEITTDTRDIRETAQYAALVLETETKVNEFRNSFNNILRERGITGAPTAPTTRPTIFATGQTKLNALKTKTISTLTDANSVISDFQDNAEFLSIITPPTDRTVIIRKYAEALAFKEAYDRVTTLLDRIKIDEPANNSAADLETLRTALSTPASKADLQKVKDDPNIRRALEEATRNAIDDASALPATDQVRALDALRTAIDNAKRENTIDATTADRLIQLIDQRKAEIDRQKQAEDNLNSLLNPSRTALDPSKISGVEAAEASRTSLSPDNPVRIAYEKALLEYALTQISKYNALLALQPNYANDVVALTAARDAVTPTEETKTTTYRPYTITIAGTAWTLTTGTETNTDTLNIKETAQYAALVLDIESRVNTLRTALTNILRERRITGAPTAPTERPLVFRTGMDALNALRTKTLVTLADAEAVIKNFQDNAEFLAMITNATEHSAIVRKYAEALSYQQAFISIKRSLDPIIVDQADNNSTQDIENLYRFIRDNTALLQRTKDDPEVLTLLNNATRSALEDSRDSEKAAQRTELNRLRESLEALLRAVGPTASQATKDKLDDLIRIVQARITELGSAETSLSGSSSDANIPTTPAW